MPSRLTEPTPQEMRKAITDAIADLESTERELHSGETSHSTLARVLRAEHWGYLAATRKRLAEVEFLAGQPEWRQTLQIALADYRKGMQQGISVDHWVLGQCVVLRCVLGESSSVGGADWQRDRNGDRTWDEACRAVRFGLDSPDPEEQMWAWSSMADLAMVSIAEQRPLQDRPGSDAGDVLVAVKQMCAVMKTTGRCPAAWPTFRQFWRWRYWWQDDRWAAAAAIGYDFLFERVRHDLPAIDPL